MPHLMEYFFGPWFRLDRGSNVVKPSCLQRHGLFWKNQLFDHLDWEAEPVCAAGKLQPVHRLLQLLSTPLRDKAGDS